MREWFAEVQRRLDMGLDPFQEPASGRSEDGEDGGVEEGEEGQGDAEMATEEQGSKAMGEEEEEDEDDDGDDSDESEVWEPSRSVRKSLSGSED